MENNKNAVVAVYNSHDGAENAIKILTEAKLPLKGLSIIGRGYHSEEKVIGFYNTGERVRFWGKYGAFWGGLWGLLNGGLYLTIPAVGPVVVLGYFAAVVMSAIEGVVIVGGLSALAAAFMSIGIPKNSVLQYEQAIKADGFLLLLQGSAEEAERAREVLKSSNAGQVDVHCCKEKIINGGEPIQLKDAS